MAEGILLIVDVQRGFINRDTNHVPDRVAALQDRFARVIATRFVNPEGSMHRRLLHWHRFAPGNGDIELAFTPRPDARILDKAAYTCLTPELRAQWIHEGVDEVHLAGIATDNCVLKTAVDLFEARIRPVVHADACASHGGPACHAAGLMLLKRFIGAEQVVED
ncbi:MAG: cysteine hydrolase [Hyphomicrobiales bacterium]|nr:cysteine hydrolase [Hyphomicrobiales bacterium]MCP5372096.1 cysteine hydrolase [Hyphomicrobiales bacterium]